MLGDREANLKNSREEAKVQYERRGSTGSVDKRIKKKLTQ
jgi:hypothetical protein